MPHQRFRVKREGKKQLSAPTNWKELERRVKALFRECGCSAVKRVVSGPGKIKYEIDCFVTFTTLGFPTKWVIECKDWGSRIPQDVATSLRQRVTDVGADKGLLVCPSGFQIGAINQAEISNLVLIKPDDLEEKLWTVLKRSVTDAAFRQICKQTDQLVSYRIKLENYLYAHEKVKDVSTEHSIYNELLGWFSLLTQMEMDLREWDAGRPSLGFPATIPTKPTELEQKTDFRDDRHMLAHVRHLLSAVTRRLQKPCAFVATLPDSPISSFWAPFMKELIKEPLPKYYPKPPKKNKSEGKE